MRPIHALAVLALAGSRVIAPPPASIVAITNVSVVDVAAGVVRANQTVLIESERIRAVGKTSDIAVPSDAVVVNARGAFLIPGLWDMHVHLAGAGAFALSLLVANGVTGVRDMGGGFDRVRAWRDSIDAGRLVGPRILQTGPVIENAQWLTIVRRISQQRGDTSMAAAMNERIAVATPDDARAAVDRIAALGVNTIKLRNDPPAPAYFALLREARRRGMRVVGHPPSRGPSLADASDSGQASIEHLLFTPDGGWRATLDDYSPAERAALFARFRANGTAYTPTIVAGEGFRRMPDSLALLLIADSAGTRDPRRRYISRALAETWRNQILMKQVEGAQPDWNALSVRALTHLRPMADAGVTLMVGTDLGTPLTYPGFAVHDELRLMVHSAGLTPAQALRAATLAPAQFLGLERETGTIAPGMRADLVLLAENPLADITNVARIKGVMVRGTWLDRARLDEMLRDVTDRVR